MSWMARSAMAVAISAGGVAVGRAWGQQNRDTWPQAPAVGSDQTRWEVVTVNRSRTELLTDGQLPAPLARLGDAVQVHLSRAPGGRGTELAARPRSGGTGLPGMAAHLTGDDPRLAVRAALREAKQLAETGQVLDPGRTPPAWQTPANGPTPSARPTPTTGDRRRP